MNAFLEFPLVWILIAAITVVLAIFAFAVSIVLNRIADRLES